MTAGGRERYGDGFARLRETVRRLLAAGPECHGWDHTLRVLRSARRLAAREHADAWIVEYAALLHDVGRAAELRDGGDTCHAQAGAARVPELLAGAGIRDAVFVRHVRECVLTHRYRTRTGLEPRSCEAKVVFDADKLDALGAIGVGRAFHFAGRIGARVHNSAEEASAAPDYSADDTAWREYLVKLRHLPDVMKTVSGRRIAGARLAFMAAFFERLDGETRGDA